MTANWKFDGTMVWGGLPVDKGQIVFMHLARLKLSGKMLVEMGIEPSGAISSVKIINSNMGDQNFEDEVIGKIAEWRFRQVPDTLGTLKIRYPFEFYEED